MLEKIKEKSSVKKLLIMIIAFLVVYIPLSSTVSNWQTSIGITLMDFRFGGYGADVVADTLSIIGEEGRSIYVHLLGLDCIMGILYMSVLVLLIGCLLKKYLDNSKKCNCLLLCPMIAMLSDWTENLTTYCLIRAFPEISSGLVAVESVCTTLKFSFIGVSVAVIIVILIYGMCIHTRKKIETK